MAEKFKCSRLSIFRIILSLFVILYVEAALQYSISTVVGRNLNSVGDGGSPTAAYVPGPCGVFGDSMGNIYISTANRIRLTNSAYTNISTVAGNYNAGSSGDGGPAVSALLNSPFLLYLDSTNRLYIADAANYKIRTIYSSSGTSYISTYAGGGSSIADNAAATSTGIYNPQGIWSDSLNNFYISDTFHHCVRRVNPAGLIATVAGQMNAAATTTIVSGAASSASLYYPSGICVDSVGNLYISDTYNNQIKVVNSVTKEISLVTGSGSVTTGYNIPATSAGIYHSYGLCIFNNKLYFSDGYYIIRSIDFSTTLVNLVAGGGPSNSDGITATSAGLSLMYGIYLDTVGSLFIAVTGLHKVRKVNPAGIITTIAGGIILPTYYGDGGAATSAIFNGLYGMWADTISNKYVTDYSNCKIRKVDSSTNIITSFGAGWNAHSGDYGSSTSANTGPIRSIWGNSDNSALYVGDYGYRSIRKVNFPSNIIVPLMGTGILGTGVMGLPATATSFNQIIRVIGDTVGNIYVTDEFLGMVNVMSASSSIVTCIAGTGNNAVGVNNVQATATTLYNPCNMWINTIGDVFVFSYAAVRKITKSTSLISTTMGGGTILNGHGIAATSAIFYNHDANSIYGDSTNNIYLGDFTGCYTFKVVLSTGLQYLLAGVGTPSFTSDSAYSLGVSIGTPTDLFPDSVGNVYIIEYSNSRMRVVMPYFSPTGQPSNQPSNQPTVQPSRQPTGQPSRQPTSQPSRQPSSQPSARPTTQPSRQPSKQPISIPSSQPTRQPFTRPSSCPSNQPSGQPSRQPSSQPSRQPSLQPNKRPSSKPTRQPSSKPTHQPSQQPSSFPTCQPTNQPSSQPTRQPNSYPSVLPSSQPSAQPTSQPNAFPSMQPTLQPSSQPTCQPNSFPSQTPSSQPSCTPSCSPTIQPSNQPTGSPSQRPSRLPSPMPSSQPSVQPTSAPSMKPSVELSSKPTSQAYSLLSCRPTSQPSSSPSSVPSSTPSVQPSTMPVSVPSNFPSRQPTIEPSRSPSSQPTSQPLKSPSSKPSTHPSIQPSSKPTTQPFVLPTSQPSIPPSSQPFVVPSAVPSESVAGNATISVLTSDLQYDFKIVLPFLLANAGSSVSLTFSDVIVPESGSFGMNYVVLGGSTLPGTLSLDLSIGSKHLVYEYPNAVSADVSGRSVSVLDDVNGDDNIDLIIGDPSAARCYVLFGRSHRLSHTGLGFTVFGETGSDLTGWSVSGAGDVNNDTISDIVIGAPNARGVGAVYVIYGRRGLGGDIHLSNLTKEQGFVMYGGFKNDYIGISVSGAGDVNRDGFDDVIAGAALTVNLNSGAAYVLFGGANRKVVTSVSELPNLSLGFKLVGVSFSLSGYSVCGVGDVNKDKFDDLLIGSYPQSNSLSPVAYLLYGNSTLGLHDVVLSKITSSQGMIISGGGLVVSKVGDVNGDGFADMLIGSNYGVSQVGFIVNNFIDFTAYPTMVPSNGPLTSRQPKSNKPTRIPSVTPSQKPSAPTVEPTVGVSVPSSVPSSQPSAPSNVPTQSPIIVTSSPSHEPSESPTVLPTLSPTIAPSHAKTSPPSLITTTRPSTLIPSKQGTRTPFSIPSLTPSFAATVPDHEFIYLNDQSNDDRVLVNRIVNRVNLIVNTTSRVEVVGSQGAYTFVLIPMVNGSMTINNFNLSCDLIDLTMFAPGIASFNDLTIVSGSAIIRLPRQQIVRIVNLQPDDLRYDHFVFGLALEDDDDTNEQQVVIIVSTVVSTAIIMFGFYWTLLLYFKGKTNKKALDSSILETLNKLDQYTLIEVDGSKHLYLYSQQAVEESQFDAFVDDFSVSVGSSTNDKSDTLSKQTDKNESDSLQDVVSAQSIDDFSVDDVGSSSLASELSMSFNDYVPSDEDL